MQYLWTISILTIPERKQMFDKLLNHLMWQIGEIDDIQIVSYPSAEETIATKRQRTLDEADGRYINFIDDDDWISDDYVSSIYPHLKRGVVDMVGFQTCLTVNGKPQKPVYNSIQYTSWSQDSQAYYRNVNHLCPVKREIARLGKFDGGFGEDRRWAEAVSPHVLTEAYVDRVLYYYRYSTKGTRSR